MSGAATRAADFIDSLGYDTHLPYTDGEYADPQRAIADLAYLGVHEVRDGITDGADYTGHQNGSAPLSHYIDLAKAGVRFTITIDGYQGTTASVQTQLDLAKELLAAVPGSVVAVEGYNEVNNFPASFNGQSGQAGAADAQRYIYAQVHGDPVFTANNVKVDYFTGYNATGEGPGPDPSTTPGLADYDTQHPYPDGQAPYAYVQPARALPNEPSSGQHVYTETGYTTGAGDAVAVSEQARAAYTLDLFADAYASGATRTDVYQLEEAYPESYDSAYGAFDNAGDPTPEATAVHDLTSILHDGGATASTFAPHAVDLTLSGLPATGHSLQLQRSNGVTDELVWAEPGTHATATPAEVTAALDGRYDVSVYDPLVGAAPVASYRDVSSVQVAVTDHPLILQLTPEAGGAASPPASSPPSGAATAPAAGGTAPSQPAPDPAPPVMTAPTGTAPPVTLPDGGALATGTPVNDPAPMPPTWRERAMARLEDWIGGHLPHRLGGERWVMGEAIVTGMGDDHYAADLHLLRALNPQDAVMSVGALEHDLGAPGAVPRFHALELAYGHGHG